MSSTFLRKRLLFLMEFHRLAARMIRKKTAADILIRFAA